MTLEKLLKFIGIERVTNRAELMAELDELPDADFAALIGANGEIGDRVVALSCAECKAANGGRCVHQGDNEYCGEYEIEAWLNRDWCGQRFLVEGR